MRSFISPSLLLIVKIPEVPRTLSNTVAPNAAPQPLSSPSSLAVEYAAPGSKPLS